MKKLILAVLFGLLLTSHAYADSLKIFMSGMDWTYNNGILSDSGGISGSDALDYASFKVNNLLYKGLNSDIVFDAYIPLASLSGGSGTFTPGEATFSFLVGTEGISLYLTDYLIVGQNSGYDLSLTGILVKSEISSQNLPYGFIMNEPITLTFSASGETETALSGTGEVKAALLVPEPATLLLLGLGMVGLGGVWRRFQS
ncbi:PEP-CTERM protein-sorting domain-containing protein [Syntrophus gentianae]|uniref:PEP-CTERM protein-sorting domain-containing protein n=1 Tax=Syntrophus gentianae TaxID=43775 RepID=A0A1H7YSL4_9BACT|nr:PEP-CTERM sorting domain-containing protein [Syntrophus gentianae]SEM48327.1 PEP-CTERM protein-sorting domain-containing protein [Syntrophus gentianae]